MKALLTTFTVVFFVGFLIINPSLNESSTNAQDQKEFQGQATYMAKSSLDLGSWGARMSEEQKKAVKARLKNRLEKTYTLTFNKTESYFTENDMLDAMSGATDSWGKNFAAGDQYKNVKDNQLVQSQEFYGKKFLVKEIA